MIATMEEHEPSKVAKKDADNFGRYELLPIKELHFDGTYQRPVSSWAVRDIVFNYRKILFQPLIIGMRKAVYYIVDGRHRKEAGIELGFTRVPCMVYDTMNAAEEAKAFYELQKFRRVITPPQQLMARIAFKDPTAIAISEALIKYKFEIDKYDGFSANRKLDNVIVAVASLEFAYDLGGAKMLDNILYVLRNVWEGRATSLDSRIIRGLAHFMRDNPYGVKALANCLMESSPYSLFTAANSISNQHGLVESAAMARVIRNIYKRTVGE